MELAAVEREDIELLAQRVADLLAAQAMESRQMGQLVDAAAVARLLGVSRATVYAKADELGAIRIGSGKRARLRFDPARIVAGHLAANTDQNTTPRRRPSRRRSKRPNSELLPIRGRRNRTGGPLRS
jgi:hypothetical protein